MLDIKLIREQPEVVAQALRKRMDNVDLSPVIALDKNRREAQAALDAKRNRRNEASAQVPELKKAGQDVSAIFAEMKSLGGEIKQLETEVSALESAIFEAMAGLPNLPDEDVLAGGKENNAVRRVWGAPPSFSFIPKDHVTLLQGLGMIDFERGAKLGGSGFWVYRGDGARLEWALLNFFVDQHVRAGYEFVLPPHLLLHECGYTAGQFPKFEDEVFVLGGSDQKRFLLPTAETALVNLHREEILTEASLPRKYFAYTPCFRREAGSYRTEERGTIRGHQFNKVELFQYCRPEDSPAALEDMLAHASSLVEALGLHHRVSALAAKDCSAGMAKTLDIEVWIPSMNQFKEVSSASNARDYQARRGQMRLRREDKRIELLHTLNASGLATSRLLPAIVEHFQTPEGDVVVPDVLQKWMGKARIVAARSQA